MPLPVPQQRTFNRLHRTAEKSRIADRSLSAHAARGHERPVRGSCTAAKGRRMKGRSGPEVTFNKKGGKCEFAADANASSLTVKSGHSSLTKASPLCCAAYQGQQCAGSGVCKVQAAGRRWMVRTARSRHPLERRSLHRGSPEADLCPQAQHEDALPRSTLRVRSRR